jgi:putative addiction module component (TIGR02574 family)
MTMNKHSKQIEFQNLSVAERLKLLEDVWASLEADLALTDIPAWHREVLDGRLDKADNDPDRSLPWREATAFLRRTNKT